MKITIRNYSVSEEIQVPAYGYETAEEVNERLFEEVEEVWGLYPADEGEKTALLEDGACVLYGAIEGEYAFEQDETGDYIITEVLV